MKAIKVLYEDTDCLVIDKPAGIAVHADMHQRGEATVADWILEHYPKLKNVGEPMEIPGPEGKKIKIPRPGIVHRIDRETSGVLLIAKNKKAYESFKKQFADHTIKKVYRAFVYGYVSDPKASLGSGKAGIIDAPIGRSPKDIRMWTAGRGAREPVRDALTRYKVLERFVDTKRPSTNIDHQFSYIEAYPKTGRTHQIRVHMRYINHPIVSDPLYRGTKDFALGMKRLALHALSITFMKFTGEEMTVEAPLPADFKKAVNEYLA